MNDLTPAQLNVIRVWTEARDTLLAEIGTLTTDRDTLIESTKAEAASLTDITNRIFEAQGHLAELDALEERHRTSVATDVAELEARKSRLEAECVAKEDALKVLGSRQTDTMETIETLISVHDKMSDQATIVDQVVGQVIATSTKAVSDMKTDMTAVHTVVMDVIAKGNENIKQTGIVIEGLPKFIFEIQKPIIPRRKYPKGHPLAVDDETTQK